MKPIRTLAARAAVAAALATAPVLLSAAPAQAATPGTWAAIAISVQTGNVGYSWNHPSATSAADAAVDKCNARGCQTVVRVSNGCAAVAQAPNRAWGWAYAASRAAAEQAAVRGTPGKGARVLGWVCTGYYR
jgi:Domain of unknown function (DUF4189)